MKKYLLVTLFIFPFLVYSQTEIFNVAGGGALPDGWVESNNDTAQPIDKSSYYLLEPHTPSDMITTSSYDLSSYSQIILSVDIKSYSSGTYNSLLIEVSTDGGTTFNEAGTTNPVTSSYVNNTVSIQNFDSGTILRLSNSGTSGRGIRLQKIVLNAYSSDPAINTTPAEISGLGFVLGKTSLFSKSFDVRGLNLENDITVTMPYGFEGSTSSDGTFSSTLNLPQTSGSVSSEIHVKMDSSIQNSGLKSDNIVLSSAATTGDLSVNLPVSGRVWRDPFVSGLTQDIFISEYCEGSGNNKYIEIYNPTSSDVDLSGYKWATTSGAIDIIGIHEVFNDFAQGASIPAGGTYILANRYITDQTILNAVDSNGEKADVYHTGDDAIALAKGTEYNYDVIDIIGDFNGDPGQAWSVAGIANATQNKTLFRKSSITMGNNNWVASSGNSNNDSEWNVSANTDDFSNIGNHTLSVIGFLSRDINIYPNPFSSKLIFTDLQNSVKVSIFDVVGKLLIQAEVTNSLDVSDLNTGFYIVEIKNETSSKVFKMLKK